MALGLAASCSIAGEPVGQRSVQQLLVDAGVIVRQMEDAKRLATCIRDSDRGGLLTNSEAVNFSLLRHTRRDRTLAPARGEICGMHALASCSAWIYPFSALFPRLPCHLRYCGRSCP